MAEREYTATFPPLRQRRLNLLSQAGRMSGLSAAFARGTIHTLEKLSQVRPLTAHEMLSVTVARLAVDAAKKKRRKQKAAKESSSSKALGHANVHITLTTYAHAVPKERQGAADAMASTDA